MGLLSKRKQTISETDSEERRKHARCQPIDGAFAFLDLKSMVAGQILNISEEGLSFRYVASEQQSDESHTMSIIVRDWNFRSKQLPCETVWDHAEPHELSFGPFSVRYCGVRFTEMTESQKYDLTIFLSRYTKQTETSEPAL